MDIVAHGLWAGAAGMALRRTRPEIGTRAVAGMVALAVLPDLVHMVPVLAASLSEPSAAAFLGDYLTATGRAGEPAMPPLAQALSHHLHCTFHSVVVAAIVTLVMKWAHPAGLLPLLGWWLHIALDVPTHSSEYYPVPIFYPFTEWAFDGIAWKEPWLLAANYAALAVAYAWLFFARRRVVGAGL